MSRFTLSKLFAPWTVASTPPRKAGWYRTRTEALTHSWWSGMAFFDGEAWWEFGRHATMLIRQEVKVLQWQGLAMPFAEAVAAIRANMPRSTRARRSYEKFLERYGAAV